jgi:predicted DsbA family dithiol-disulfide isomerase
MSAKQAQNFPAPALFALLALLIYVPFVSAHPGCNNPNHIPLIRPAFVDSLKKNFRVRQCCASSLDACAKQKPNCAIAPRLISFIDWMNAAGGRYTEERVAEALQQRYATFTGTKRFTADQKEWPVIGDRNAPMTVVMYFSGTCPLCKTNFRDLHRTVTSGQLKGRVKIVCKPLGTGLANRALTAAYDAGRFSDFMFAIANVQGRIDEEVLLSIADNMLFDRQAFKNLMESPEIMKRVDMSTREAERNGVTHVPTYFIAGQRYNSVLEPLWIVDAIEYMMETGK